MQHHDTLFSTTSFCKLFQFPCWSSCLIEESKISRFTQHAVFSLGCILSQVGVLGILLIYWFFFFGQPEHSAKYACKHSCVPRLKWSAGSMLRLSIQRQTCTSASPIWRSEKPELATRAAVIELGGNVSISCAVWSQSVHEVRSFPCAEGVHSVLSAVNHASCPMLLTYIRKWCSVHFQWNYCLLSKPGWFQNDDFMCKQITGPWELNQFACSSYVPPAQRKNSFANASLVVSIPRYAWLYLATSPYARVLWCQLFTFFQIGC